jgi:hypothetical protein
VVRVLELPRLQPPFVGEREASENPNQELELSDDRTHNLPLFLVQTFLVQSLAVEILYSSERRHLRYQILVWGESKRFMHRLNSIAWQRRGKK